MRVVVFGATGDQGSAQVRALVAAGHQPVAVSRRPRPWSLQGQAVETLAADFADPASLVAACAGADAVFLNLPSTPVCRFLSSGADSPHRMRATRCAGG
jgi:uncharacterized protein YbjT (DUF2867 family)